MEKDHTKNQSPSASLREKALFFRSQLEGSAGEAWLAERGVSLRVARMYGVGFDARRVSLTFPLHDRHGVCALSYRHISTGPYPKRWIRPTGSRKGLFGAHLRAKQDGRTPFLLFCEGESDTLAAAEALERLGLIGIAVGLPGVQLRPEWISEGRSVVALCAPDHDASGARLRERAIELGVAPLRLRDRLCGGKDLRDLIAQPDGDRHFADAIAEALFARELVAARAATTTTTQSLAPGRETKGTPCPTR